MKCHQKTRQLDVGIARRIARLDKWILALALLWAGTGTTLLLEAHRDHQHHMPPGSDVTGQVVGHPPRAA